MDSTPCKFLMALELYKLSHSNQEFQPFLADFSKNSSKIMLAKTPESRTFRLLEKVIAFLGESAKQETRFLTG
jgi:hypothetical protein